ncbi:2-isopropylmalate synthase/homocitrate synthase family protein [Anaeromyxobacter sp. K]|uniref:citramalate synthase n=1 Tax=Anaeromyxobacter sp. (strain K) TaxID=447217 RepID=UPI00015F8A2C|nr:citramalate synthase [Anaeromyxobacter sp. K]ACG73035.1 2-isopropylmalate synthase/homocitrate synthase family protein [Anaeromyxobacter sp. K]HET9947328.1 citramalate synthase [Longimicrobiales bacterium]
MIQIYDTTLRDGTQREGISLSCEDKLRIARRLDELGVTFIEGGWPGSNPKDAEFFERARDLPWKHARIAAFGSTCRVGGGPEDDANIRALLDAGTPACTVVGKTWTLHVTEVLRTTFDENLRIIEKSLAYLRAQGRRVIYDAEHFFDGWRADPGYALETLRAAVRGGAETLVLCDTNGGSLPWQIGETVAKVQAALGHPLGVHCHNDSECAVANSLAAVHAGAVQVQGTVNGYGERCGNANLCSIIPALELKLDVRCLPEGKLSELYEVAHFVAEVANLAPDEHLAYVGRSAFAHKGGIHVAAMRRSATSYQHVDPERVGNTMRVVVSELSGRGNLLSKAEEYGIAPDSIADVGAVLNEIKALEARGFAFEAAEASVAMLMRRQQPGHRAPFELVDFLVNVEHRTGRGIFSEAMVKVRVGEEVLHTAAEGDGPVDALTAALQKALAGHYPQVKALHLSDYKVRILDGQHGTAAVTRVLIDMQKGPRRWSTVGASQNIIEASWIALVDAVEYGLALA